MERVTAEHCECQIGLAHKVSLTSAENHFSPCLLGVCLFHFSALSVSKKCYCSHRTQKNFLHLRAGLPTWICSWILPLLPLTLLPLCIYLSWALWIWNCADIWARPQCLGGKIHSINSGSDTLFLVPVGKSWAFLQPASLGGWQPQDECDSLLSPVTVAAFPVKFLHQCQMYSCV